MAGFTLFGWEIKRSDQQTDKQKEEAQPVSFTEEQRDDGAIVVEAGGNYGFYIDMEGTAKTEAELVSRYRNMAQEPEIEMALDDIVNEAIAFDAEGDVVSVSLDEVGYSEGLKNKIQDEFQYIRSLFDFNDMGYDIFRRWYIDGRLYYHLIVNEKTYKDVGIEEVRYVDPRKIRKVREVGEKKEKGVPVKYTKNEYYLYNEKGFGGNERPYSRAVDYKGIKIANDAILHVTSGLTDRNNKLVLSYLHKAIKPLNQLRAMEDASVIYRLVRAPERRIFNIDVGNLPKAKAEQHVRDMMTRHKNKLVYDATTGEIRDDRKFMTMMEDFWLPKRDGRGTTIDNLPGGQNLGEMEDVLYFQKKLNLALNIPITRLEPTSGFALGRTSEISRDEVKFTKFVDRLRRRFSKLFLDTLKKQLILKGIINEQSWEEIKDQVKIEYAVDNHFSELKNQELLRERVSVLDSVERYIGKYFSEEYVKRVILNQSEEEIEQMKKEMDKEGTTEEHDQRKELEFGALERSAGVDQPPQPEKQAQPAANKTAAEREPQADQNAPLSQPAKGKKEKQNG